MARYDTVQLDAATWDLTIDNFGNIAMATPGYSLAQDVASAIKLFQGEQWYDTTRGVPYFADILGELPPMSLFVQYLEEAAQTVPGVKTVQINFSSFDNRTVTGQVLFIDEVGQQNGVTF